MSIIHLLVEGELDEAVARRVIEVAGHIPGVCYGKKGYGYIEAKVPGFNHAAKQTPYLTLVDFMDTKSLCPPEVLTNLLPHRHPNMIFRVVVREIESWLLADKYTLAQFLKIAADRIPQNPEQVTDPKQTLVNLARHSKSQLVRSALVPDAKSTAQVGRLYNSEMKSFIYGRWNIEAARKQSISLEKCLFRLESFV